MPEAREANRQEKARANATPRETALFGFALARPGGLKLTHIVAERPPNRSHGRRDRAAP